ncbi:MAG TPA: PAS domain S-box protein [Elusimicrobiales bacterium]|nr:PAS domain S-box protein [Elusimicrobiales bacterium]
MTEYSEEKNIRGAPLPAARRVEDETLLETMAEGVYLLDARGRVVFINKAAREILGYAPEEVLGRNAHEVFHHSKKDGTPNPAGACPIGLSLKDGKTRRLYEEIFWTRDGRPLAVDCTAAPFSEGNVLRGLVITFRDITTRQEAREALGKAKEASEQVFQLVPSAIYAVDAQQRIIKWNKRAEEITGYTAKEIIGKPCSIFAETPCRSRCGLFDKNVKKPINCAECTLRAKDGRTLLVVKNADTIKNEKGEVIGGIETFEDITERKLTESRLRDQEASFRAITGAAQDAILMMNNDGMLSFWNQAAERILGWSPQEAVGRDLHELIAPERFLAAHRKAFEHFRGTGQGAAVGKTLELAARRKDGREIPVELSLSTVEIKGKWCAIGILRDISRRKNAEKALTGSETKFRSLYNGSRDALMTLAPPAWNFTSGNPATLDLFGAASEEEFETLTPGDLSPERQPDGRPSAVRAREMIEKALREGSCFFEWTHKRLNGREFPATVLLTRIELDGKALLQATVRDISALKRAEELRRSSRERLDMTLRSANMGVWSFGAKTSIRVFDAKACEVLGLDPQKYSGTEAEFFSAVHPDDIAMVKEAMENTLKTGSPYTAQFRVLWPGGEVKYISARGTLVPAAAGLPERISGVIWDVTEARLAQEAIKASEDKYRGIFESFLDLYYQADIAGTIRVVSPSVEQLSGWTVEEALGKNIIDLYAVPAERAALLEEIKKKGSVRSYEVTLKKKDGTLVPTLVSARFKLDAHGNPAGIEGTLRDITEIKNTREELRKAKEAAEAASRAKSDFLANMSHEIRTPMNSIIGMTEILLDGPLSEEQRRQLNTIQHSADALLYIINDILDLSKIEAGQLKIEQEPYDPREVAESVTEMFAQRAAARGLELILKVSTDMPAAVLGDGNRLRQIFINLVGNALKFTLKGQIKISAEFLKADGAGWLAFSVADTGIGISPENQKKLFSKFSQVDDSSTRKYGGTGLGLSISKALVEMMGGAIALESAEGAGSIFSFRLPCRNAPAGPARLEQQISFAGMRALLVDDNPDSLEILAQNMAVWGFTSVPARSAAEAVKILKSGKKFDLLVVDHQMPGGNGEQFIAEAAGGAAPGSKILMLSSRVDAIPESVKPAVDAFLSKPVTRSALFNSILKVFRPAPLPGPEAAAPKRDYSHLRLLLVEDNADNQNLARLMLEGAGYKLDIAANGREALEKCAAFNYDLVLMDIQMPEMDGHEAAFQLRKTEAYKKTPIIALTAHGLDSDIKKSLSFGMNAHITKPLKRKVLYAALDKWLDTRLKVLVADDNPDNLALVELHLKGDSGLRIYRAANGQEALEMTRRNVFSLVLMDMEMPVMDGLTAVRELRKTPAGKSVPIIAFSAHTEDAKRKECLDTGFTDYMVKPVKKAELLEKVNKLLYSDR